MFISLEPGLEASVFQGPGESPGISGEGKGVTSAMALSMGDETAELGVDPKPELLPMLLANIFFMLGVRFTGCMGMFFDQECVLGSLGEVFAVGIWAPAAVTV
jgi:hypothetical protein